MKKFMTILAAAAITTSALAAKKMPLKVLYVGGMTDFYEAPAEVKDSLVNDRADAFKSLLQQYFTDVDVLIGDSYSADMSKGYDVTIMDGVPKAITPRIVERDAQGNVTRYEPATYLPADFDCATVTIGQIGNAVGRSIGVKNDWYCLCLDAHAHSWVKDHPIFKGPFKVKMSTEMLPTPEDAYHYNYFYDEPLPESMKMWRVQTKGYQSDQGFSIGMVARPWGYTDSPETEYISSGVCAKTIDAVAIGRHGNFLHWGFAASPRYMTDEAKTVFANAVAYISKFNGKKILARKMNDRIATREYLKEVGYLVSRKSYEDRMVSDSLWTAESRQEYNRIIAKQKAGEELTGVEKQVLSYGYPGEFKRKSYEDYMKRYAREFFPMFGTDEEAYVRYFKDNYEYFYSEGFYNIFLDDDVKAWGIPNHDTALLDKAIRSLEEGKEEDRARRILARYTMAHFDTPAEWREWFDTYKDRMFFTESGGWKFLINAEGDVPGNDYAKYKERVEKMRQTTTGTETSDVNPVIASAKIEKDNMDALYFVVKFKIHPGYHIYANVSSEDPYIPTKLDLKLPEGLTAGEWSISQPGRLNETGTTIHEMEAEYRCPLKGHGTGPIVCDVAYQACDSHICMPPAKKALKITL